MHFFGAMLANIRQTDVFDKNNLLDAYFDWFGNEMTLVTVKQLEKDQNGNLQETKALDMIHVTKTGNQTFGMSVNSFEELKSQLSYDGNDGLLKKGMQVKVLDLDGQKDRILFLRRDDQFSDRFFEWLEPPVEGFLAGDTLADDIFFKVS